MPSVELFVQTVAGRQKALAQTLASLAQAGVPEPRVVVHPPGIRLRAFFVQLLKQMAESSADYVVRLEDDVVVNRHLVKNILSWGALSEKNFGCGWLFVPDGVLRDGQRIGHSASGWAFRKNRLLHCAQGIVVPTRLLPQLIPLVERFLATAPGNAQQDLSFSAAVWDSRRRVYLADPPLVEHRIHTPSTLGHQPTQNRTSGGRFQLDWDRSRPAAAAVRRPAPAARPAPAQGRAIYHLCLDGGGVGAMSMSVGPGRRRIPPPAPRRTAGKVRFIYTVSGGLEGAMTMVPG